MPVCHYFQTPGIGNNVVWDNIRFIGHNRGAGLTRIFLISVMNVTFSNIIFDDFLWTPDSFGKLSFGLV